MKVLLIEDEPSVAGIINKGLTENKYQVSVAPDGNLGLQMATAHAFDIIILDVMLPGINGMEVCRRLRASKNQTPILFLTALGTTENIVAGLEMGGDDYLVKPFKLAELEARIASYELAARMQTAAAEALDISQETEATQTVKMVVLCRNSEGAPEFHTCAVEVTPAQRASGDHYEMAEDNAVDNGYEPQFAFEENDPAAKQMGEIHAWL